MGLTDSGGSKQYVRDGVGVTSPVLSDGASTFTAGGERTGGVSKALHSGLKNDDLQTNATGSVIGERLYDAFGNVVSNTGAWSSHSGYGGKFGYQEDPDSSLKLLGHRYYDATTGRFLSRDRIREGRNWYVYCDSAPIKRVDPNGLLSVGIGSSFGGFFGIVGFDLSGGIYIDLETGNVGIGGRGAGAVGVGGGLGINGFISIDNGTVPPPGQTEHGQDVHLNANAAGGLGGSASFGGTLDSTPGSEWKPNGEGKLSIGPEAELSISNQWGKWCRFGLFNLVDFLREMRESVRDIYESLVEFIEDIQRAARIINRVRRGIVAR